ncbi:RNA polymerase III RPC4 domain-containing protein [Trichoderma chlorosporum]
MVRGRATGRGAGRGGAASSRAQAESSDSNQPQSTGNAAPTAAMGLAESSTDQGASSQSASTARRGATSARAARAAASAGRFRPKNVRRDESERDALAQQEQQKASDRAADERRARGRSRFRSKRSRGDAMGSRGGAFGRPVAGASGPFSSGMGGPGGTAGGGWFGAGGSGGGGGFSRNGKFEAKPGSGFGFASEGGFRETRINADKLHTMAHDDDLDSEDEAMLAALHARSGSVMPMGILRREHKEAPVVVATTAELEAAEKALSEEESLWVDGEAPGSLPPADQPEEGDWNTSAKRAAKVKREPADDTMDLDVDVKPAADEGKQPLAKMKAKKPIAQDHEENMIRTDLSLLASELGAITINGDGEEKADEAGNKDGRLYLFQFPPLLPPLKQVAAPQPRIKVKEEEHHSASLHATPLSVSSTATPVDLTQQADEEEESDDEDEEQERRSGFRSQALSNGGLIGRLNVRKSGKVELDWGGRILEMSPAAGMNFLTTAVIVEESDEKPQNGVTTGESIGMGKIMGRFVLAPIWNEEEEWEVTPEELDIGVTSQ